MTGTSMEVTALEQAGAVVTETSLRFSDPQGLTWEKYMELGLFLATIGRAYPFWVGDFLLYGEEIFGAEFAQIEKTLPHSPRTLANYQSIAKHIPPNRRRPALSHSVHEAVAYLPPKQRDELLDEAERQGWKRDEMREAKRALMIPVGELTSAPDDDRMPGQTHTCPSCGHVWTEG